MKINCNHCSKLLEVNKDILLYVVEPSFNHKIICHNCAIEILTAELYLYILKEGKRCDDFRHEYYNLIQRLEEKKISIEKNDDGTFYGTVFDDYEDENVLVLGESDVYRG